MTEVTIKIPGDIKDIEQFEDLIASYVGTKYAVTFNSGTSALHAALLAHEIKNGDEVEHTQYRMEFSRNYHRERRDRGDSASSA